MKRTHSHNVTSSFVEWLDHTLLYNGDAYQNMSSRFFYNEDNELPDSYNTFGSAYKQFVYDSSVTGANIFSGVYGEANIGSDHASGIFLDYRDGRVLAPSSVMPESLIVTGNFAVKDFNVYLVTERDETLLFEDVYKVSQSRYGHKVEAAAKPYQYYAPACFVISKNSSNKPFSFGGQVDSIFKYRVLVAAATEYDLEGCCSLLRDQSNKNICILSADRLPLNEYGDIKTHFSGVYNYLDEVANAEGMVFINSISAATVGDVNTDTTRPKMFVGFVDFELSSVRYIN